MTLLQPTIVPLRMITPLWTGDAAGSSKDAVREMGVLGSIRWWLEALARGVGAGVPDPVTDHPIYDKEKANGGLDPVSYLFGATGWKRRFRLTVASSGEACTLPSSISIPTASPKLKRGCPNTPVNHSCWFFPPPNSARTGLIKLRFQPLAAGPAVPVALGVLHFLEQWAALGAKSQLGLGVFTNADSRTDYGDDLLRWLKANAGRNIEKNLPSTDSMFFAQIRERPQAMDQFQVRGHNDTFWVKYHLRRLITNAALRHRVMGEVKGNERIGSKVSMSMPFGNPKTIRIWGWIPRSIAERENDVLQPFYEMLSAKYELQVWRECNSSRDSLGRGETGLQFVERLIGKGSRA